MASPQREAETAEEQSAEAPLKNGADGQELPDLDLSHQRTEMARESFGKAFVQVLLATAILGGGLYLYWNHVQTQEEVRAIAKKAKERALRDNYQDLVEARKLFDQALELDSNHEYVVAASGLLEARLALDHGLPEHKSKAEAFISQAEGMDSEKAETFGGRGLLLVLDGKAEQAEKRMDELIKKGGRAAPIFDALGYAQMQLGKLKEARTAFRNAAESEWKNPRYNASVANLYFLDEDFRNADSYVKKALDTNPEHLYTKVLRARVNIARGEGTREAKEAIDDVLGRPPEELSPRIKALALVARAELLSFERKFKQALAAAEESLGSFETPDAHIAKGLVLAAMKKPSATEEIKKGLELFPYQPRAYHQGARALLAAGRAEDALALMDAWGEKLEKDDRFYIAFGNLLLSKGDKEKAKQNYEKALEIDKGNAEAYYRLGALMREAKDYDKAIDYFNKAVAVREHYPEVYEAMGWIYMDQGHYNDALPLFAQALTYYKAQNADRKMMRKLIDDVADALKKSKKKSWVKPWRKEAKDLIR
ncbi:MAG: tetratricopeptide repeat protein [Deltaproteobacteria bacterium]|nr:MAG: tetratricopeptide repeat protein [Deltaproteobacteria bacterium]